MINVLIIDDEKRCIETLRILLNDYNNNIKVLDAADSVEGGLQIIQKHAGNIDILFLDIRMPDGDGFTLLKELENIDFSIIFTTAFDQFALQAIKFSALDYLLKPINNKELTEALTKFEKSRRRNSNEVIGFREKLKQNRQFEKLAIPTLTDITFVDPKQILYLESDKNYSTFYFAKGEKLVSSKNIGYYEELLTPHGFYRIHNSFLVNISKAKRYIKGKNGLLELENGIKLEVSGRRKDDLFTFMSLR